MTWSRLPATGLIALAAVLALASDVRSGGRPARRATLRAGPHAAVISTTGALAALTLGGTTVEAAEDLGAGEIRYGTAVFPLNAPRWSASRGAPEAVYTLPTTPRIEARIVYRIERAGARTVIHRDVALTAEAPLHDDLAVHLFVGPLVPEHETWIPRKDGVGAIVGTLQPEPAAYRFAGRAPQTGIPLAIPLVTFPAAPIADRCTLVADPYFSTAFTGRSVEWEYPAAVGLADRPERRRVDVVLHSGGPEEAIAAFYAIALRDVPAGPRWLHDIAMVDYDYMSDGGGGWTTDIDRLASAIPRPDRRKVLLCLHAWYDWIGSYSFDVRARRLRKRWTVFANHPAARDGFPNSKPLPMSLREMHHRIRYATSRGFRVALYFADGLNAGTGLTAVYSPDRVLKWGAWQGPDTAGVSYVQNPLSRFVFDFYLRYARALLAEFGSEIDALVWDETFHVDPGSTGSDRVRGYADRAMMRLVAAVSAEVHRHGRRTGRPLALLTSDDIGLSLYPGFEDKAPFALVADGTFQDSSCDPKAWSYGIFPNYRNVVWSCNWQPVSHWPWTVVGARQYQAPVAISNGWGDDTGFGEMTPDMQHAVLELFHWRATFSTRLRWLDRLPSPEGDQPH